MSIEMSASFRRIIVPLARTQSSESALSVATPLVGSGNGELIILRIEECETREWRLHAQPAGLLARVEAAWAELGDNRRRQKGIAQTIVGATVRHGADLIAMSTRARSTLRGWLLVQGGGGLPGDEVRRLGWAIS
jgi:nucleotide-binding universal stress UspA family protein